MNLTQIRNATIVLTYKGNHILVDPMLAEQGALPRLRYLGKGQKNPLVSLPSIFSELSNSIQYALITHCQKGHFDHLDRKGVSYLRKKGIEVFAHEKDERHLQNLGLNTKSLKKNLKNNFFDGTIELINARHGIGGISFLMEHGVGYFVRMPECPSLYIMGDTVLTDEIKKFIQRERPDFIVAPTGMAQFDIGKPILLTEKEIIELSKISSGKIIANHMEALDHCRINRQKLREIIADNSLQNILIPMDGETIELLPD